MQTRLASHEKMYLCEVEAESGNRYDNLKRMDDTTVGGSFVQTMLLG